MDRKTLITNLNRVFCDLNKKDKKYTCVWLADEDFGGLYNSGKYVLNVQASHDIGECSSEIKFIIDYLSAVAKEELKEIVQVSVYDDEMDIHCIMDIKDLLVFTEEAACK